MKVSVPILHRPYLTPRLVSMVDAGLFDKLDEIGRQIRGRREINPSEGFRCVWPYAFVDLTDQRNQVDRRYW